MAFSGTKAFLTCLCENKNPYIPKIFSNDQLVKTIKKYLIKRFYKI